MRATFHVGLCLLAPLLLSACATPPPSAYISGASATTDKPVAMGKNASGESCTQLSGGGKVGSDIYCGTWHQPAARVLALDATEGTPMQIATASTWRSTLDQRFICAPPSSETILGGQPAALLQCSRRIGGWPQVALVARVGRQTYAADGVLPTLPVIERSIGVQSGRVSAAAAASLPSSAADALVASRLAERAFTAGDVGDYERLMALGAKANLAENFAAAEIDYRAALALQQKALGQNNPDQVTALMHLALQINDQGRFAEAEMLFRQADALAPHCSDHASVARLLHYRALAVLNQHHMEDALALLDRADAAYTALVPPEALRARAVAARGPTTAGTITGFQGREPPLTDPGAQSALLGLIEVQRYRAIVLRDLSRPADSATAMQAAETLAQGNGLVLPLVSARLYRTAATTGVEGDGLARSASAFAQVLPQTRPVAETAMLRAAAAMKRGDSGGAISLCRVGGELLRDLRDGADADLLDPCLLAYAERAAAVGSAEQQTVLAEMFELAELSQDSITSRQIAEAAARLSERARDPKVAEAIRRSQDAGEALAELYRERDAALLRRADGEPTDASAAPADLDKRIAAAQAERADAEAVLQTASPNYGQLVQQTVPAAAILSALRPNEAFAAIIVGNDGGWVFLLRDRRITAVRVSENRARIAALVKGVRATVEPTTEALPDFDMADAAAIYAATLGRVAPQLAGATALVVAPSGPLLSLPFSLLPTGPASATDLTGAPWLIRRMTVEHVPAAANFVALRRATSSHAPQPWFGFGDFKPVSLPLAEKSFPGTSCADSAKLFAGLPPLPFARRELEAARVLLGAAPSDQMLGAAFTADAVRHAQLKPYRILHFAAHALLPAELRCQAQPAIVTSAPAAAQDASGALLSSDVVIGLDLDADTVILSACNSGGPGGDGAAGESLSGLTRAFFYAGARSLLVTHWSINDQASAFLIVDTLRRLAGGHDGGGAGALRAAQLGMLASAGHELPSAIAHPFYWAPFALIGDDGKAPSASGT